MIGMLWRAAAIASFPLFVLAVRFIPFDMVPSMCAFLHFTGYPCPTCGMTRSVSAVCSLDLAQAVSLNPLGLAVVGLLAFSWVIALYEIATGRRSRVRRWAESRVSLLAVAGLCVLVLFGLLRVLLLASA